MDDTKPTPPASKADQYSDAIIIALTETAERIGGPDINAALAALAYVQAYLISRLDSRPARFHAMARCDQAVRKNVTALIAERHNAEAGKGKPDA